jgi:23S rRNA (cytosine1962-C5)-methyltransferase
MQDFFNRVAKSERRLRRWARREGLEAYRIYDRDIPEHRHTVDVYGPSLVVMSYPSGHPSRASVEPRAEVLRAGLARALGRPDDEVFVTVRRPRAHHGAQYQRLGDAGAWREVAEQGLRFRVNLSDYVDTGLFLDHRRTRARIREEAAGRRFLNLFCYTGSFTAYAAAGGAAQTTSVDLSNTYLDWARANLALNGLDGARHELVRADVLTWLRESRRRRYDLVFLDPPSFSSSKRMDQSFEVERDHPRLLADVLALLSPRGVLYFSTNFRGFELDPDELEADVEELTPGSLPEDFRDRRVHRLFRITPR